MLRGARAALTIAVLSYILHGCASRTLTKHTDSTGLKQEIPQEMQDKFEVKEAAPAPAPQPTLKPVVAEAPVGPGKRKKRRKKGKEPEPVAAPAPAPTPAGPGFAYPSRRPAKDPVWVGERTVYEVSYFGVSAGDFILDVLPFKTINNRKVYHIKGNALSSKVFSLFYRLNDSVESYLDYEGLFSHRFHLILDESKQTRDALELYDSEKAQTFYWNRWDHKDRGFSEVKETKEITPFSQDSLSALYYLRMIPLADGSVTTFPVVSEGNTWEAVVSVIRREEIDTPMGRMKTVVVKPETRFRGILQKKGDSFIWLTDDDRRWVVRLEAQVKIGTVVARLREVQPGSPP